MTDHAEHPDIETPERKRDRFEDLARKLLRVPKADVEAAEAARKKRKPRRKQD